MAKSFVMDKSSNKNSQLTPIQVDSRGIYGKSKINYYNSRINCDEPETDREYMKRSRSCNQLNDNQLNSNSEMPYSSHLNSFTSNNQRIIGNNIIIPQMERRDLTENQVITNDPNYSPNKRYYVYSTLRDRRKIIRSKEDGEVCDLDDNNHEIVREIETVL